MNSAAIETRMLIRELVKYLCSGIGIIGLVLLASGSSPLGLDLH